MVRPRSASDVPRNRNLTKTMAALPKKKKKAAQLAAISSEERKRKAAISSEERKRMAAARAVDVEKILRLKREAIEAMETKCFPLTARANLAAAAAKAKMAAESGAEEKKVPDKKRKVVTYLVSQRYIEHMKVGLFNCVDEIPEEELVKRSQLFQEGYRASVLFSEKLRACQQVLLDQYNVFGYAYDAKEVTDDEAEDEEEGEMVVKN